MSALLHLLHIDPPLLESGDRMSREEFLARWEQMPGLKRAELIDGVVYIPSPVSRRHGRHDLLLQGWIFHYIARCPFVEALSNSTWLMQGSAPQPDVAMRLKPEYGGRSRVIDELIEGAPELAIEVAGSSRSYDLGPKLDLYRSAGVGEYIAVLLEEKRVEWRVLRGSDYAILAPDASGILRSAFFPGLWLDEPAFWANDAGRLVATIEKGTASPEFQEFLSRPR